MDMLISFYGMLLDPATVFLPRVKEVDEKVLSVKG